MSLVNIETGEIAKSPESVVEFLENAKWMLDAAVEMTGPGEGGKKLPSWWKAEAA